MRLRRMGGETPPLRGVSMVRVGDGFPVPKTKCGTPHPSKIKDFCHLFAAANPVAALTVHRTVIHYRDCASLTPDKGSLRALPRQYNYLTNWNLSKCHTKFINKIFITVFDGRYMNQNNLSIKLSQKMPVGIITQIMCWCIGQIMGYANSS